MTTRQDETPGVPIDRRAFARRAAGYAVGAATALGPGIVLGGPSGPTRVRVWSEGTAPRAVYPHDIDGALARDMNRQPGFRVARARLDQPRAGLSDAELDATDVLVWWGRLRHGDVPDDRARAVAERVRDGRLGFVALHASCLSKPFVELMGAPCELGGFREDGRPERVEVKSPGHPIARGIGSFVIPRTSMFAEPFRVPEPESLVLVSKFDRGETFRSGMTWTVGKGRVAYFRPGHDGFPVFFHPAVRRVIANAAAWASGKA